MLVYPTNLPDYNKFRVHIDPDDIDVNDIVILVIRTPRALRRYLVGNALLISDINAIAGTAQDKIDVVDIVNQEVYYLDFCDEMVECINNNQAVQDALAAYMQDSGLGVAPEGVDTVVGTDNDHLSDENILTGSACGTNDIAGECVAIVEALNTLAQDYIEQFAASSLATEYFAVAAEATPLLGHLTPNDAGIFVDWVSDEVLTQYEGSYDTALRNEAACMLYDLCCQDCDLSIDEMIDAFSTQVSIGINPAKTWALLLADIATLSLGDQIVYGLWLSILATWKAGDEWMGMNNTAMLQYAATKSTPIDPATLGCDPCGTGGCNLPITVNFEDGTAGNCGTIDDGAIVSSPALGSWSLAKTTQNDFSDPTLDITIDDAGIQSVTAQWQHYFTPLSARDVTVQLRAFDAMDNQIGFTQDLVFTQPGTWTSVSLQVTTMSDIAYVQVKSSLASGATALTVAIDDIQVSTP